MLPIGGTDGWVDEIISTELAFPRNEVKVPLIAKALIYSDDVPRTLTYDADAEQLVQTDVDGNILHTLDRPGVLSCDLAFDLLDREFYCWMEASDQIWMYWFNSLTSLFETTNITTGQNVCCAFDERRTVLSATADIFLFYQRGEDLFYRLQRDRYTVEYPIPTDQTGVTLLTCGMGTNLRMTLRVLVESSILIAVNDKLMTADDYIVGYPWGTEL